MGDREAPATRKHPLEPSTDRRSAANRPHQREIIQAALDGYDVYVQAATSFGKSLCFQLPAVVDQGSESVSMLLSDVQ